MEEEPGTQGGTELREANLGAEGGDFAELKGVGPGAAGGLWPWPRLCSPGLTGSLLEVLCAEACRCVAV